jgi:DNA-binding response OmpR family regulator
MPHPKIILLIEDSPEDILLTRTILRQANNANELVALPTCELALDYLWRMGDYSILKNKPLPVLTLLDIDFKAKMDGLTFLRQLRESPKTLILPVVIFTNSDQHAERVEGLRLGAGLIQKPLTTSQLLAAARLLGKKWWIDD